MWRAIQFGIDTINFPSSPWRGGGGAGGGGGGGGGRGWSAWELKNALSTNGINQAVNFGKHLDKCPHIPDACGIGSTFSLLAEVEVCTRSQTHYGFWGYYSGGRGYAHIITSNGFIAIHVKDSFLHYKFRVCFCNWTRNKWAFIVQIWSPSSRIKIMSMVAFCWLTLSVLLEDAQSSGTTTSSLTNSAFGTSGRGISTENCGVDDVSPPDAFSSRQETQC